MPQREVHLRDYLAILRNYDFIICLSVLLTLGTALIVGIRLPKTYVARTLIEVTPPTSNSPVSSSSLFQSVLSGGADRNEMETIAQRFSTTSMLKSAQDNLENAGVAGVRYLPPTGRLRPNVKARIRPETHYIEVSVQLTEEEGGERNAALLTNELVAEMQAVRHQKEKVEATQRLQLLNEKLNELLKQVQLAEERAFQFVRENGSPSTWSPMITNLLAQREKLQADYEYLKSQLDVIRIELNYFQEEIKKLPESIKLSETISQNPVWLHQRQKLVDLKSERIGRAEQIGENSLEMKGLDAQIKAMQDKLSETPTQDETATASTHGTFPLYSSIQLRLINLRATALRAAYNLKQLEPQLEAVELEWQSALKKIPENELFLEKLRKEIETHHDLIKEIYKQQIDAEILLKQGVEPSHGGIQGGIEIIDAASPRKDAVSPRINFIAAIAGIIGAAIGLSIALLTEYFGNTYKSSDEVESDLDMLNLGRVAAVKKYEPSSPFISEAYRTIAANIGLAHPEMKKQVIMLTGCNANEDVSTVTANLGTTLSSIKERVLIVDCNLSQPIQHQIFNIPLDSRPMEPQLEEQPDWAQLTLQTHIPNLDLLSASIFAANPIDFLRLPRLHAFFEPLRERYELVLLDAPPILPTADSLVLSAHADAVILVVHLDQTTQQDLRSARDRIVHAQIPTLGFIEI